MNDTHFDYTHCRLTARMRSSEILILPILGRSNLTAGNALLKNNIGYVLL